MEKQLQELKDAEASGTNSSGRKKKASPQVQVCQLLVVKVDCIIIFQATVTKIYKSLAEDDLQFGWNHE